MRLMKLAMTAVAVFAFGSAYAFHDGGVAECDGCHVMHNASGGVNQYNGANYGRTIANANNDKGNIFLLQGTDQSSTCLRCHGSDRSPFEPFYIYAPTNGAQVATPSGLNYTPGGDFSYLKVSYTYSPWPGATHTSKGERHGHNIVAADFPELANETTLTVAPGGTFTYYTSGKQAFACSNCHDPHGRSRLVASGTTYAVAGPSAPGSKIDPIGGSGSYGASPTAGSAVGTYRLLGGVGYTPVSQNGANAFQNPAPIAAAPDSYNQADYNGATAQEVRVAYGRGMAEWCSNCHTNIHLDAYVTGAPGLRHPAGKGGVFQQVQADIYNSYISSGDLSGSKEYTSLVPFESYGGTSGLPDLTKLAAARTSAGTPGTIDANNIFLAVAGTTNVMCVSCHRAHASGFDSMLRWDMDNAFIADGGALQIVNEGRSAAQASAAYYGRTVGGGFVNLQRSMCNKCHAKD